MRTRTLAILAVVFVALAVAATWPLWGGGDDDATDTAPPAGAPDLDGLTAGASEVRFAPPEGEPRVLDRGDGGEWTIDGAAADQAAVEGFFAAVEATEVGDLASRSADNHDRLGVDEESATALSWTRSGEETTVLVGTAAAKPARSTPGPRVPTRHTSCMATCSRG